MHTLFSGKGSGSNNCSLSTRVKDSLPNIPAWVDDIKEKYIQRMHVRKYACHLFASVYLQIPLLILYLPQTKNTGEKSRAFYNNYTLYLIICMYIHVF